MRTIVCIAGAALFWFAQYCCAQSPDGDAIWKRLQESPPTTIQSESRQVALRALDSWISRPDSERSPELIAYYRRAVDRVVSSLKSEKPKAGLRYFQLYSSGEIIQTPTCVFAIDLDQGPNKGLRETPQKEGTAFCMADAQIGALAELIDISFHTHEHSDHIDYAITKALMERGKTVVVTESNKKIWDKEPWAEKLVVLKQTLQQPNQVGPLKVDVLHDHQWNNDEHKSGTPCNAYLITTPEGMTVGTKGDINCALQFYGWLNVLAAAGRHIDLMVGSPLYWHGVNLNKQIDAMFGPVWAPGHNWEFEHRPSGELRGNASPYLSSYGIMKSSVSRGSVAVLSWGEYMDIVRK